MMMWIPPIRFRAFTPIIPRTDVFMSCDEGRSRFEPGSDLFGALNLVMIVILDTFKRWNSRASGT